MSGPLNLPVTVERDGTQYVVSRNGQQITYPYSLDMVDWDLWLEAENARRHYISVQGNVDLDGNGSVVFPGAYGDWIATNKAETFGTDDFTVDIDVTWDSTQPHTYGGIFSNSTWAGGGVDTITISVDQSGNVYFNTTGVALTSTVSNGVKTRITIERFGNTFRLYKNGAIAGTATSTVDIIAGADIWLFGQLYDDTGNRTFKGSMQNVLISIGTARHNGAFTPLDADFDIIDANTVLSLNFEGSNASTRIIDEAKPVYLISVSDNFNGIDGNSNACSGRIWNTIWESAPTGYAITSGGVLSSTSQNNDYISWNNNYSPDAGTDYTLSVDITISGSSFTSSTFVAFFTPGGGMTIEPANGGLYYRWGSLGYTNIAWDNKYLTGTWKFVRSGNTGTVYWNDTLLATATLTAIGSGTTPFNLQSRSGVASMVTFDFDNYSIVDGLGNEIPLYTDDGATIPVIADLSSSKNDAFQTTKTYQPLYDNSTTYPKAIFDGSDDSLSLSTINFNPSFTIFTVADLIKSSNYDTIFWFTDGVKGPKLYKSNTDKVWFYFRDSTGALKDVLSDPIVSSGRYVIAFVVDAVNNELRGYVDGTLIGSLTVSPTSIITTQEIIGKENTGAEPLNGSMVDLLIYNGVMEGKDFRRVTQFLKAKYGIN